MRWPGDEAIAAALPSLAAARGPAPPVRHMSARRIDTPLGPLWLGAQGGMLTAILPHPPGGAAPGGQADARLLDEAEAQITACLAGRLPRLALPLALPASPFAHCVWEAVLSTRPGDLLPLAEIARALSTTPAAVARAARGNRLFLALPCHRLAPAGPAAPWPGPGGAAGRAHLLALEGAAGQARATAPHRAG